MICDDTFDELADWYITWIRDDALPFWSDAGFDARAGGFCECLDFSGRDVTNVPRRLMVQARQLYTFCHAAELGWYPGGKSLADATFEYMRSRFQPRPGYWIHSILADGSPASTMLDTYAVAFVLTGLAWYYRVTADAQIIAMADKTLIALDEALTMHCGGYADAVPRPDALRRQNPHMHLFEAFIALYEATRNPEYLARAGEMFRLFSRHFFRTDTGSLCEYMSEDLDPVPAPAGQIREPGHHYEWVWLLRKFEELSGRDVSYYCQALYTFANTHGWDSQGYVVAETNAEGRILSGSRRTWPHTEALKATLVERHRDAQWRGQAAKCLLRLRDTFVGRPFAGGWIDRFDSSGNPLVDVIPASTLYHLFCAAAELHGSFTAIGAPTVMS